MKTGKIKIIFKIDNYETEWIIYLKADFLNRCLTHWKNIESYIKRSSNKSWM